MNPQDKYSDPREASGTLARRPSANDVMPNVAIKDDEHLAHLRSHQQTKSKTLKEVGGLMRTGNKTGTSMYEEGFKPIASNRSHLQEHHVVSSATTCNLQDDLLASKETLSSKW